MPKSLEIIAGLFRESSIVTVASALNVGKTPLLQEWAVCIAAGIPWCGHAASQRPVLLCDYESWDWYALESLTNIAVKHGVSSHTLPITYFIERSTEPVPSENTLELSRVGRMTIAQRIEWLAGKLAAQPRATIMLDPVQRFFPIDYNNGSRVTALFSALHELQCAFPAMTVVSTFNLRKEDPRSTPACLLKHPARWLQEASGSLNIQNRSDVRLGLAPLDLDEKYPLVLNGLRRSEEVEPLIIGPVWEVNGWAGFEIVASQPDLEELLTPKMLAAWRSLSDSFTLVDLEHALPRATAYRMRARCLAQRLLTEPTPGRFHKEVLDI